ncbi:MAG TPA: ribosome maturation factor RimM [Segeticoccus sp.]|uniref:ribosome maturation factor RimM n=1 Tax=Segeticoccus sp. TaxID=2706531 RepID=UPI002D7F2562|nr:ribosome maturation factor RimM [Segeticoccus sp.]HET8601554.1 ribosome maturation factor RimM [Segeticoccus sp.]
MQVRVARIGKAHGLRGEVTVQVHTDNPEERFAPGTRFVTRPASAGPLTLRSVRQHGETTLLGFAEATDRTAAEALRGTELYLEAAEHEPAGGEEGWYEDELVGLVAVTPSGERLGTVRALEMRPVQDLLVLTLEDGGEARIPFVEQLVPEVDLAGGRVVVDPPEGLLELDRDSGEGG